MGAQGLPAAVFFGTPKRFTSLNQLVRRLCIVSERGVLYLCDFETGNVTRTLALSAAAAGPGGAPVTGAGGFDKSPNRSGNIATTASPPSNANGASPASSPTGAGRRVVIEVDRGMDDDGCRGVCLTVPNAEPLVLQFDARVNDEANKFFAVVRYFSGAALDFRLNDNSRDERTGALRNPGLVDRTLKEQGSVMGALVRKASSNRVNARPAAAGAAASGSDTRIMDGVASALHQAKTGPPPPRSLADVVVDEPKPPNSLALSAATSAATSAESTFRQRMRRVYLKHAPERLELLEPSLLKYRGNEEALMSAMVQKYGPEPPADEVLDEAVITARVAEANATLLDAAPADQQQATVNK